MVPLWVSNDGFFAGFDASLLVCLCYLAEDFRDSLSSKCMFVRTFLKEIVIMCITHSK